MPNKTTVSCYPRCCLLTSEAKPGGDDPPLPPEHLGCVLREFAQFIRAKIRVTLRRLPIGEILARLRARTPGVALPTIEAVQAALAQDDELVHDLEQDVALALFGAMGRGGVRAARAVVHQWLSTTVPRVVRRKARGPALLAFAAAPSVDHEIVEIPTAGLSPETEPVADASPRSQVRALVEDRPDSLDELTDAEREALELWLAGVTGADSAVVLGITPGAVRLRVMRARRALEAANDNCREEDGDFPPGPRETRERGPRTD